MSGPEQPESIIPTVAAAAPLAPTPQPTQPSAAPTERSPRRPSRLTEIALALLVLAFAFLAASFVARNADFWLHLATGRLLAHGRYVPSSQADPFAYTTAGVPWVNHAWLLDWIAYLLYRENADAWLVVLKAAMIAVLAGFMLLIRRPGKPGWIPAFCTALALLVMSPGLLLQPLCVSVVLLGPTLWLLWRCRAPARLRALTQPGSPIDARALLIPLCALWVNLDDWFLLCPLLVGLFWIGDRIQPAAPSPPTPLPRGARGEGLGVRGRPTPSWLLPACLAACLCSPYHVFGFTLPADLFSRPFSSGLLHDVRFRQLSPSPWLFDAAHSPAGANLAGFAYFLLVAVGIASFAVNRTGLRDWRVLTWVVFALLGAWSVRLVPFFAVIGGPVAALNWQGMTYEFRPAVVKGLRTVCVMLLLALIVLTVPGWIHGFNQKTMQVAWGVEINRSLRRAAETLYRWRQDGRLGAGERSFCMHPDAACYCAWFGPRDYPEDFLGEKSFLDARFSLFPRAADDYLAVCRGLDPALASGPTAASEDWRRILLDRGVSVVVLYDPDPAHVLPVLIQQYDNPAEWTLLSVDGQASIVGWNPARTDRFAPLRFAPGRFVFGAADEDAPAAPGRGPGRDPREPDWLSRLGRQPALPWESTAARVEMLLFQDPNAPGRREAVDHYYLAARDGLEELTALPFGAGLAGGPLGGMAPIVLRVAAMQEVLPQFRDKPPELALLAVRAARRAIAAAPDDERAYLQLAAAYLALRNETTEHSRAGGLTPLAMLRHVQIVTALHQALIVNPDLEAAHQLLADLFLEIKPVAYIDLAFDHRRTELQLARRFGHGPGESAEAFQLRVDQLEAQVKDLEKQVHDAQDVCEIRFKSIGDDPLARARIALDLGLAGKALDDVLMKARVEVVGTGLANRELELLLLTGRAREAKNMLDDEQMRANKVKLLTYALFFGNAEPGVAYVFPTYEWLQACAAAAVGDYDTADAALDAIGEQLRAWQAAGLVDYLREVAADVGDPAVGLAGPLALAWLGNRVLHTPVLYQQADRNLRAEWADVLTLTALLDLERGAPADAAQRLKESIGYSRSVRDEGWDVPGAALAEAYLKRMTARPNP